ncbi:MAG: hypothetical protein WKF65_09730 [Gaiellaceae bacterium]
MSSVPSKVEAYVEEVAEILGRITLRLRPTRSYTTLRDVTVGCPFGGRLFGIY